MNEKFRSIFHAKKGKVFQYKQQLFSRFSNEHVPVQFGVDYSPKIKPYKSQTEDKVNKSSQNESISNVENKRVQNKFIDVESKPIQKKLISDPENKPTQNKFISDVENIVQVSPKIPQKIDKRHETFETVSKIHFQKSPPVNRKVIQISSKSLIHQKQIPELQSKTENLAKSVLSTERPKKFNLPLKEKEELKPDLIVALNSPFDKDTRVKEFIDNQLLSPVSEPEALCSFENKKKIEVKRKFFTMNKTNRYSTKTMSTETVDPTLVSVAQRAKSIMSNKTSQSSRSNSLIPVDIQTEGNDESLLSIKDRIRLFKDNLSQSASTPICQEKPQKHVSNRFKTQPLSFDDIARANAMILDQSEVASTIASPSITNSNETLVDFSEESNSSSNKTNDHKSPVKLRKSNAIIRAQSCLINSKPNVYKSMDEEIIPSIKVKDFIKSCDKKEETIQQKIPKNAVVSRKLAFKSKAEEEKSYKQTKQYSRKPHLTQPITKLDMESSNVEFIESNQSIKDRISQMQSQGENNWRRRVHKDLDIDSKPRPGSVVISNLQEKLQVDNEQWKKRVEQKDVGEFTAVNKLGKFSKNNNMTKRYTIHGQPINDDQNGDHFIVRLKKDDEKDTLPPKQTLISDIIVDEPKVTFVVDDFKKSDNLGLDIVQSEPLCTIQSHMVNIPNTSDQSLSNFFSSSPVVSENSLANNNVPTNDDFDDIFLQSDLSLNIAKRSVRPTRNQRVSSRNPLKKLNERSDIKNEYEERLTGVAERELKRCQIENIQSKAGYVEEALAGLTAKEDFSKIKLKRTDSNKLFEQFVSPYKDVMLISVKGRKNIQVRLVEPVSSSINIGDCYLLLTKQLAFVWIGECANVIEINKVNELGSWITKCKELNYSGSSDKPIVVKSDENSMNNSAIQFWKCLHYDTMQMINPPGDVSEDELYERMIQRTNMIYKVVGNQLVPLDEYWGSPLKHKMLTDDQVFIFDFGTELYLWSGSKADMKTKANGRNLLKILFSKGYNYESCSINPLDPLPNNQKEAKPSKGSARPNWVIVGRLPQKGETTLFKEKFSDWPETSRLIKSSMQAKANNEKNKHIEGDLQPVEIEDLLNIPHPSVHSIIDGKSVGRGGKWKVIEDGILREFSVVTKNVNMWHITDNAAVVVAPSSMGQFFSGDAYIIKWDYELITHGRYTRNNRSGNLLSAFFFWQGTSTSITEKTASALLTIDLDKDRTTQIRVKQHHESPAFCRLFGGTMVVHIGKQQFSENVSKSRLFIIRGEIESEAHFVEVLCDSQSLRERGVFLLLNIKRNKCYLWFGNCASAESRSCAFFCAKQLLTKKPIDLHITINDIKIEEIEQGKETRTFWEDMGIIKKWKSSYIYHDLVPIRGWFVSGLTGVFVLNEMNYSLCPDSENNIVPAFPLLQATLYKSSQPTLFLIWTPVHIFIWEGWWMQMSDRHVSSSDYDVSIEEESEVNSPNMALPRNRIASEKLALLKSVDSWLKQNNDKITGSIVYAGLEPLSFQELFPFWEIYEEARTINLKRGYVMNQEDDVANTLNKYLTMTYSVERLRERPLPENVISSRIESYLTQEDFEELFKMSRDEFYELSSWKQHEKKKEVDLF